MEQTSAPIIKTRSPGRRHERNKHVAKRIQGLGQGRKESHGVGGRCSGTAGENQGLTELGSALVFAAVDAATVPEIGASALM